MFILVQYPIRVTKAYKHKKEIKSSMNEDSALNPHHQCKMYIHNIYTHLLAEELKKEILPDFS